MRRDGRPALRALAFGVALMALPWAGCEWFNTMADPPAIQPHERQPRLAPENAIPLGGDPEFTLANPEALTNPASGDSATVEVGRAYYRTFCAVCHGESGLGNGPISDVFPAIPSVVTPQAMGRSDAYLYALIAKGRGLMPEYSRIPPAARWAIVEYLRTMEPGTAGAGAGEAAPGPDGADDAAGTEGGDG